jgi:phosphonate transport system substrate-binding protein
MLKNALRIIGALTTAVLLGSAIAPAGAAETGQRLVLGRISAEPHKHLERLGAMAEYLAPRLVDQGIAGVDVVIADSPARMRSLLEEGKVDLVSETAFMAIDFMDAGVAKPLLREWKKGVAEYHSVIFVRKDSGLRTLSDFVGRKFAFEDPGSTSGYLMPRVALEDAGLHLALLPDPRNPAPDDALGYSFANGEINVVAWVNRGLADGGAVSNLDWDDPETAPAALKDELRVIHETTPVIRSLMLARQSFDDDLCERIAVILESMHESPEGRAVLKKYAKVLRYDRLEGEASRGLEEARSIWRRAAGQGD